MVRLHVARATHSESVASFDLLMFGEYVLRSCPLEDAVG